MRPPFFMPVTFLHPMQIPHLISVAPQMWDNARHF